MRCEAELKSEVVIYNDESAKMKEINKKVTVLQSWMLQHNFPDIYNANFVENMLIGSKFDISAAKKFIENYFVIKDKRPDYFMPADPYDAEFRLFCKAVNSVFLPKKTSEGQQIYVDKVRSSEEILFDPSKIMKYFVMQTDVNLMEKNFGNKLIILFDCNDMSLLSILAWIPFSVNVLRLISKSYPIEVDLLVIVNAGTFLATVSNSIRIIFREKVRNSMFIYSGGGENFKKHVPLEFLPADYGGTQPFLDEIRENVLDQFDKQRDWFSNIYEKFSEWRW